MKKLFLLLILLPALAWGGDYGSSIDGETASVTLNHTASCDSGRVWYGYPDTTNWYVSYKLTSAGWDNTVLLNSSVSLDSLGTHIVRLSYWETGAGSVSGYLVGIWEHNDTKAAAACGEGIGDNTTIIYVLNSADSTTGISGFDITIQDSVGGEYQAYGTTNSSGCDTFSLDDGTFKISMSKTPWSITSPVYKTTAGDSTWTFYATHYDPGAPPSASKCNVWTLISDLSASWLAGCRLTVWVPSRYYPLTFDTTLVSPYTVDAVSNDTGYVEIAVYRSAELTAGNEQTVKMYIEARAPNGDLLGRTFQEIPDQESYEVVW